MLFDQFVSKVLEELPLSNSLQEVFVIFSQEWKIEKGRSPYFPAFFVNLSLFIILLIFLILVFNLHGLSCVAHHSFHVKVKELAYEPVEWIITRFKTFSKFARKCFEDIGEGSERSIQDITDDFYIVYFLTALELIYDLHQ